MFDELERAVRLVRSITGGSVERTAERNRSAQKAPRPETAKMSMHSFIERCSPTCERSNSMASNIKHFIDDSQLLMPTRWLKTRPFIKGMVAMDLTHKKTMKEVRALCDSVHLISPMKFVKTNSFHYGKRDTNGKLVSFLSICVAMLNRTPGSIAISVDLAASVDKNHSMTDAINSLKKLLRKHRHTCVLFAQVADTEAAKTFWKGKLTFSKRASVMTTLFHEFDPRYTVYSNVHDMALFFE